MFLLRIQLPPSVSQFQLPQVDVMLDSPRCVTVCHSGGVL